MTRAEAMAYNVGARSVVDTATRTAAAIMSTSRRHVHEGFVVA